MSNVYKTCDFFIDKNLLDKSLRKISQQVKEEGDAESLASFESAVDEMNFARENIMKSPESFGKGCYSTAEFKLLILEVSQPQNPKYHEIQDDDVVDIINDIYDLPNYRTMLKALLVFAKIRVGGGDVTFLESFSEDVIAAATQWYDKLPDFPKGATVILHTEEVA